MCFPMKTEGARADQLRAFPDVPGKYRASMEQARKRRA